MNGGKIVVQILLSKRGDDSDNRCEGMSLAELNYRQICDSHTEEGKCPHLPDTKHCFTIKRNNLQAGRVEENLYCS